jgi:hypothetical protein
MKIRGQGGEALVCLICVALVLCSSPAPTAAATFEIIASDRINDGFNDGRSRAPVGGNPGTTLGKQRINVIRRATTLWGAVLSSDVVIKLSVGFDAFGSADCQPSSAWLGFGGPTTAFADFVGAPRPGTLYPSALADSLAGTDLNPAGADISAALNQYIDSGCFSNGAPNGWYYGYDGNGPRGTIDLLQTVMHELAHGLGFTSFIGANGARCCGSRPMDDAFMINLEWHEVGLTWPFLTDEERVLSSIAVGGLHWVGPNVQAVASHLTAGRSGTHVEMYAPPTYRLGTSVSHFSTTLAPNELLEPFLAPSASRVLTLAALQDLGWVLPGGSASTPVPTPTATEPVPTATSIAADTATPTATLTATATPSPVVTPAEEIAACACDCDHGGAVSINEVQGIAAIYLGTRPLNICPSADASGDGLVSIHELQQAANQFLGGCP